MNKLTIPPAPNWFESSIITCAIDNTLIYGSRCEIVIIHPKPADQPAEIKIIPRSHVDRINSVAINPNWGEPDKLIVSTGDDKLVHLWDVASCTIKSTHKGHTTRSDKVVGAAFAGHDRIVSISEEGIIMLWRLATNEVTSLNLFIGRDKITCLSSSPHTPWLVACGTKKGIVLIIDLRKTGTVLHRLKGHENNSISSLSWCPTPYNIFPKAQEAHKIKNSALKSNNANLNDSNVQAGNNEEQILDDVCKVENEISSEPASAEIIEPQVEHHCCNIATEATIEKDLEVPCRDSTIKEAIETNETPNGAQEDILLNVVPSLDVNLKESVDEINVPETNIVSEQQPDNSEDLTIITNVEVPPVDLVSLDITQNNPKVSETNNSITFQSNKTVNNQPTKECVLASASKMGKSIVIWNVNKGLRQTEFRLSGKPRFVKNPSNYWISLCWYKPKSLLSSSFKGELLQWNLGNFLNMNKYSIVHNSHENLIFNIVSPIRKYENPDDEDWRDRNLLNAWTIGKDRFILNTSFGGDNQILALYPTFAGSINCLEPSPVDPTRVAIASGDGTCRLWDLSRPHIQYVMITTLWEKIHTKVVNVAWHPTKETCLSFATSEGKIGLLDTGNCSKQPTFLIQRHGSGVYGLQWGPLSGDSDNFGLYCIMSGKIFIYNPNKPLTEPTEVDICKDELISQISWKPDYSVCAAGTKEGAICFFSKSLQPLKTLFLQYKSIKCFAWHPEATAENSSVSSCANWLAVADTKVIVYDSSLLNGNGEQDKYIVAEFSDHDDKVFDLAWSPHVEGRLASASSDGSALVWDVKSKMLLHCCQHENSLNFFAVLWSPLDPDYLITGSKESIIKIWKLSENLPQEKSDVKVRRKIVRDKNIVMENESKQIETKTVENKDENHVKKIHQKYILGNLAYAQNKTDTDGINICRQIYAAGNGTKIQKINELDENSEKISVESLYQGDKEDIKKLLEFEKATNTRKKLLSANHHISLWQGDIGNDIKLAIATKTLNPWLVNMAPMISHGLWQTACETYAKQLSESSHSNAVAASSYYLACHKVEQAIETLCNGSLFREALALAKTRLLPDDPLINEIIQQWANKCVDSGLIEISVQCYIAIGELNKAIRTLLKRPNKEALEFCVELARDCDSKDLLDAALLRLKNLKTETTEENQEPLPNLPGRAELELTLQNKNNVSVNEPLLDSVKNDENTND